MKNLLIIFALLVAVGWLGRTIYRSATKDERHDREEADCRLRAQLERSYAIAVKICLTDRYGWSEQDVSLPYAQAMGEELVRRR